jgi:hypothetical protein
MLFFQISFSQFRKKQQIAIRDNNNAIYAEHIAKENEICII